MTQLIDDIGLYDEEPLVENAEEIKRVLFAESADDPEGWEAKLNVYHSDRRKGESFTDAVKRKSSAYSQKSPQYKRAKEKKPGLWNSMDQEAWDMISDTVDNFVADPEWNRKFHESPNLYLDENGIVDFDRMKKHLRESWGEEVDLDNPKKIGKELYYNLKPEKDIKLHQKKLKEKGYYDGEIDGLRGPLMKEGTERFQKDNNLDSDGIIGKKTLPELLSMLNPFHVKEASADETGYLIDDIGLYAEEDEKKIAKGFDPEGEGYDYEGAKKAGLSPDETGHWASRDPETGLILKGAGHETFQKTLDGEKEAGYEVEKGEDGRYYSQKKQLIDDIGLYKDEDKKFNPFASYGKGVSKAFAQAPSLIGEITYFFGDRVLGRTMDIWEKSPIKPLGFDLQKKMTKAVIDAGDNIVASNRKWIEENYENPDGKIEEFAEALGSGTISLGTALAIGAFTGGLGAGVAFGGSQKLSSYKEAREKGKHRWYADTVSGVLGFVEGGLEYQGVHRLLSSTGTPLIRMLKGMATEAIQEFSQTASEGVIKTATGIRDFEGTKTAKQIFFDSLMSAAVGAVLGGVGGGSVAVAQKQQMTKQLEDLGADKKEAKIAVDRVMKQSEEVVLDEAINIINEDRQKILKENENLAEPERDAEGNIVYPTKEELVEAVEPIEVPPPSKEKAKELLEGVEKPTEPTTDPTSYATAEEYVASKGIDNVKPTKKGYAVVYHNTSPDKIDSIVKSGLLLEEGVSTDSIFVTRQPASGYGDSTVAIQVPKDMLDGRSKDSTIVLHSNIKAEDILVADKGIRGLISPHSLVTKQQMIKDLGDFDSNEELKTFLESEGHPNKEAVLKLWNEQQQLTAEWQDAQKKPTTTDPTSYATAKEYVEKFPTAYHGTSRGEFEDLEIQTGQDLLYGKGIYLTESPKLASEYASKTKVYRALTNSFEIIDAEKGSRVFNKKIDLKHPFDVDKTYSIEETNEILSAFPRVPTVSQELNGAQIFQVLRQGERHSYSNNQIVDVLGELGFDGLTHIGGRVYDQFLSGNFTQVTEPHRVWVAWDKSQIKTKQQLTAEWQDAQGEKKGKEIKRPARTYPKEQRKFTDEEKDIIKELSKDIASPETGKLMRDADGNITGRMPSQRIYDFLRFRKRNPGESKADYDKANSAAGLKTKQLSVTFQNALDEKRLTLGQTETISKILEAAKVHTAFQKEVDNVKGEVSESEATEAIRESIRDADQEEQINQQDLWEEEDPGYGIPEELKEKGIIKVGDTVEFYDSSPGKDQRGKVTKLEYDKDQAMDMASVALDNGKTITVMLEDLIKMEEVQESEGEQIDIKPDIMEIMTKSDEQLRKEYPEYNKKRKAEEDTKIKEQNNIKDELDKLYKEKVNLEEEQQKWKSKNYKSTKGGVTFEGDEYDPKKKMSYTQINEARRKNNLIALKSQIESIDKKINKLEQKLDKPKTLELKGTYVDAIVAPSAKEPGKWQATYIQKDGTPSGDSIRDTFEEAVEEARRTTGVLTAEQEAEGDVFKEPTKKIDFKQLGKDINDLLGGKEGSSEISPEGKKKQQEAKKRIMEQHLPALVSETKRLGMTLQAYLKKFTDFTDAQIKSLLKLSKVVGEPPKKLEPEGEQKPYKLPKSVRQRAISEGLEIAFPDDMTYTVRKRDDVSKRADAFIEKDFDLAMRIALGEAPEQSNLRSQELFTALSQLAILESDVDTIQKLATSKGAAELAKKAGQRVQALDAQLAFNPVKTVQNLLKDREEDAKYKSSPENKKKLKALSEKLEATESRIKELEEKLEKAKTERTQKGTKKFGSNNKIFTQAKADAARESLRKKLSGLHSGIDPTSVVELSDIGGYYFEGGIREFGEWSKTLIKEFGNGIKPHLRRVWNEMKKDYAKKNIEVAKEKVGKMAEEGDTLPKPFVVQRIAEDIVELGVASRNDLVEQVMEILQESYPDITFRETSDLISGYGKYSKLSDEETKVILRDIKGQLQQISKLEDMQEGIAPSKTGVERRTPSDEERRLIKLVEQAKRKYNIKATDPDTQLKNALDSYKTRLRNQIKDLKKQIEERKKIVKTRTRLELDRESRRLLEEKNALTLVYRSIFGRQGLSLSQRIKMTEDSLNKSIALYEKKISEGDISPITKQKDPVSTKKIEGLRSRVDALKNQLKKLREQAKPKKTPQESALQSLKTRLKNETKRLEDRLDRLDFETKQKRETLLDAEAQQMKRERDKIKATYNAAKYVKEGVTKEEIQNITELAKEASDARKKVMDKDDWTADNAKDVEDYFYKKNEFEVYVENLKPKTIADNINKFIDYLRASILASPRILRNSFLYQVVPGIERTITKRIVTGAFSDADLKSNIYEKLLAKMSGIKPSMKSLDFIKRQTAMTIRIYHKTGIDISRQDTMDSEAKFFGERVRRFVGKSALERYAKFVNLGPKWLAGGTDMLFASIGRADTSIMMSKEIAKIESLRGILPEGMTEEQRADQLLKDSYSFNPKDKRASVIRDAGIMDAHMMNNTQGEWWSEKVLEFRNIWSIGKIKFGKLQIPFAKIANVVAAEGVKTATPIGVAKSLYGLNQAGKIENVEQRNIKMRDATTNLIRYLGLFGTAFLIAALLDDDDYIGAYNTIGRKEYELARARNAGTNYVRIAGRWIPLRYLPMLNIPISAIMTAKQAKAKGANPWGGYLIGMVGQIMDTPGIKETSSLMAKIGYALRSDNFEKIAKQMDLDWESLSDWAKVRMIPSVISYDGWNYLFPPDKKYDFMGREIEKSGIFKEDKSNKITIEMSRLSNAGHFPTISDPSGKYAILLEEQMGEEKYTEYLANLKRDYADEVYLEITSLGYKNDTDKDKKKVINKIRKETILDEIRNEVDEE